MDKINRKFLLINITISLGFLISIILGFLGRGSFVHHIGVLALIFWIGIPVFILTILLAIISKFWHPTPLRWIATTAFCFALFILIQLVSIMISNLLHNPVLFDSSNIKDE